LARGIRLGCTAAYRLIVQPWTPPPHNVGRSRLCVRLCRLVCRLFGSFSLGSHFINGSWHTIGITRHWQQNHRRHSILVQS
jgi:hypothetical protein